MYVARCLNLWLSLSVSFLVRVHGSAAVPIPRCMFIGDTYEDGEHLDLKDAFFFLLDEARGQFLRFFVTNLRLQVLRRLGLLRPCVCKYFGNTVFVAGRFTSVAAERNHRQVSSSTVRFLWSQFQKVRLLTQCSHR